MTLSRYIARFAVHLLSIACMALNMIGYSWMGQESAAADLQDHMIGSKVVNHCSVALVGWISGPFVNLRPCGRGASSLTSSDTNRSITALFGWFYHGTAIEHGVLEQNLLRASIGATSGMRLFDVAASLRSNNVFYSANSSNWSTIRGMLANWNTNDLNNIESNYINNGYRVILPKQDP
jgi:hypothetical protein